MAWHGMGRNKTEGMGWDAVRQDKKGDGITWDGMG